MDKGPWQVAYEGLDFTRFCVASDDFKHDVTLTVTGDFADNDELRRYCEWLRDTLNKATANSTPTE